MQSKPVDACDLELISNQNDGIVFPEDRRPVYVESSIMVYSKVVLDVVFLFLNLLCESIDYKTGISAH